MPRHPLAHDVLRLILGLDGDVIQRADPRSDLLRRALEKRHYFPALPYMDRFDSVSLTCSEHSYSPAIWKQTGVLAPLRSKCVNAQTVGIAAA